MKLTIKTKNITLSQKLTQHIEKKMFGLKKFIDILKRDEERKTLAEVFLEIKKETKHHKKGKIFSSEAIIWLPGKKLVALTESDSLLKSVVSVKKQLKMEIDKYKFRLLDKNRREQRKAKKDLR
jgi:ribosomal subunit interface protein